jgi:hypothetical protein
MIWNYVLTDVFTSIVASSGLQPSSTRHLSNWHMVVTLLGVLGLAVQQPCDTVLAIWNVSVVPMDSGPRRCRRQGPQELTAGRYLMVGRRATSWAETRTPH